MERIAIDVLDPLLYSRGPSFVPTPVVDCNDLQENWLDFKRKIRWQTFYHGSDRVVRESPKSDLQPPHQKTVKEPPTSNILAIEVFLNKVEKDLINCNIRRYCPDNISIEERKALKTFRAQKPDERNLVLRLQDKGNNFLF